MRKLAVIIVFFIVNIAYAQVINDDCANATLIVPSSTCSPISGSLLGATNSSVTNSCSGNRDVFYKFVAIAASGTIKVAGATGLDVVVSLMNACNAASSLYCVDSYGSGSTETINMTNLVIGSTYYIKVQAYSVFAPSAYTFTICVMSTAPVTPANDDYVNAIELPASAACSPVAGTLQNATTSPLSTSCYGVNDVFYKFTAVTASTLISVTGTAGLDVVVSLLDAYGTSSYCNNNTGSGGAEAIYATGLNPGIMYYIQVKSYTTTPAASTFSICIVSSTTSTLPVNDECANAINITTSPACVPINGTLQNATTSQITGSCYGSSDVFYKFTATSTTATVNVVSSYGLDAVVGVYSICGTNSIACKDAAYSAGTETVNLTGLTVGSLYYIQVEAYGSYTPSTYTFTICVQSTNTIIPLNDECSNAISLTPSLSCNPISGTLFNASNSAVANSCNGSSDVFYSFEATAATASVSVVPSTGLDVALGVFESCSGANINCADVQAISGAENLSLSGLVIGNTYVIQVLHINSTSTTDKSFSICVMSASPPSPLNDECADALTIYPAAVYTPITGTAKNAKVSTVTGSCTGNSDVFYKFTAVAKSATITVVGSGGFDPVIGLFKACGTSYIDCADFDYNVGGTEILTPTNLTIGATYYIKVQDYSNTLPTTFTFTVAVQSTTVPTDTDASTRIHQINLFPNPTQNVLNLENIQIKTTIELIDLRGRVLLIKNSSEDTQIDLSEFASGIYILKLSADGVIENRRVVLSR